MHIEYRICIVFLRSISMKTRHLRNVVFPKTMSNAGWDARFPERAY